MLIGFGTSSPLSFHRRSLFPQLLALLLAICVAATSLSACGVAGDKPSTSAPGGISDPDALSDACAERMIAIFDWTTERLEVLAKDLIDGRKSLVDVTPEEERINKESGQMVMDLESNCAERAEELRQLADRSDQESRSSSDCDDCLSVRQLAEEFEANSFATEQRYRNTRHNFGGEVESIDREPSVPPKPLVRVRSDGARITFRFGWDEDYSWVLRLSKGDWVKANCKVSSIGTPWGSGSDKVIPFLDECTKAD